MSEVKEPTVEELATIRRFVAKTDIGAISDELRKLVEEHWPELVWKLPPQTKPKRQHGKLITLRQKARVVKKSR